MEFFVNIAQVVVALTAIFALYQGIKNSKYNRLAFFPHISDFVDSSEDFIFKYEILNSGPGIALIRDFIVKVDDTEIIGEVDDVVKKAFEVLFPHENYSYDLKHGYIGYGASLAPNSRFTIAKVTFNDKGGKKIPDNKSIAETIKDRADLIINYESVYKDSFSFDTKAIKNEIKTKKITRRGAHC